MFITELADEMTGKKDSCNLTPNLRNYLINLTAVLNCAEMRVLVLKTTIKCGLKRERGEKKKKAFISAQ